MNIVKIIYIKSLEFDVYIWSLQQNRPVRDAKCPVRDGRSLKPFNIFGNFFRRNVTTYIGMLKIDKK